MHLIYLDESGQTGTNLKDAAQPVFVLGALVVAEDCWLALEKDLQAAIEKSFPAPRPEDFEVHATDDSGIPLIEPLIHVGDERLRDVNAWLEQEQKKGRPGK